MIKDSSVTVIFQTFAQHSNFEISGDRYKKLIFSTFLNKILRFMEITQGLWSDSKLKCL